MESKKINQLATELTPALSDLTIIGDPTTGISKKITLSQMASLFTGTVEEYPDVASFPLVGVADTIYIALDTNVLYRWDTTLTSYVELSPNIINSLVFSDANGFDGNISLVGSVATLTITTALTTGSVPFIGASGALLQDNANFFWDDSNNRLGIGTNAPTTAIDVFGSGIIGRLNGTSTNNSFLGFASAGTNQWSIGNVQSDHRFRIYSEANTAELVSVLQTGEFGIGIANPTTKLHIDGGASALIANLDANVSVAKSISFRSDNSNRINLEVSGTESGSNAGANFFIRRYSDAGALIDTPFTITRSTGAISLATALNGTTATFSGIVQMATGSQVMTNGLLKLGIATGNAGAALQFLGWQTNNVNWQIDTAYLGTDFNITPSTTIGGSTFTTPVLSISSIGSATFSYNVIANKNFISGAYTDTISVGLSAAANATYNYVGYSGYWGIRTSQTQTNFCIDTYNGGTPKNVLTLTQSGFLGLGTVTPGFQLDVNSGSNGSVANFNSNRTGGGGIIVMNNSSARLYMGNANWVGVPGEGTGSTAVSIAVAENSALVFARNAANTIVETMRITNLGEFIVNSTTISNGAKAGIYFSDATNNGLILRETTNNPSVGYLLFNSAGTQTGSIIRNGSSNAVLYQTTSDYRLKEDLKDFNGLDLVNKIKTYDFKWKSCNERMIGVLAHELKEVLPFAVSGNKDDIYEDGNMKYQGVDYSMIVSTLVKAIQELNAKIDAK